MKKMLNGPAMALMFGSALLLGGCGWNGGPIITGGIGSTVQDTEELSIRVKQALKRAPQTAVSQILVTTVSEDSVKLSGYVDNDATRQEAERIAGQVPGVRFVVNSLNTYN